MGALEETSVLNRGPRGLQMLASALLLCVIAARVGSRRKPALPNASQWVLKQETSSQVANTTAKIGKNVLP